MATHVRRLTFVVDQEPPVKSENCCFKSSEQSVFDLTHETSNAFTPFLQSKASPLATFQLFDTFKSRVVLCSSIVREMKNGVRKDYLSGRVSLWNQRIEHIERIQDRLPRVVEEKKAFHKIRKYSAENST